MAHRAPLGRPKAIDPLQMLTRVGGAAAARAVQFRTHMTKALRLIEIDRDLYMHQKDDLWKPPGSRGVFGGQILAGAMSAAQATVRDYERSLSGAEGVDKAAGSGTAAVPFSPHSLHAYFLLPGDSSRHILYKVERLRNGRSFATRSVTASQNGQVIFGCDLSYQREEPGEIEHCIGMPAAPPPESVRSVTEVLETALKDPRLTEASRRQIQLNLQAPFPIEVRPCGELNFLTAATAGRGKAQGGGGAGAASSSSVPAKQLVWMRCLEPLGDDPDLHRSVLVYASDWTLSSTMLLPAGLTFSHPKLKMLASLDHTLHFAPGFDTAASPFQADEWFLYEMECPLLRQGRGLNYGRIWQGGRLVASMLQEALMRTVGVEGGGQTAAASSSSGSSSGSTSSSSTTSSTGLPAAKL